MKKVTTKIIHIPYLEFTGNETDYIILTGVYFSSDSMFDTYVESNNNGNVIGRTDSWSLNNYFCITKVHIQFGNNYTNKSSWYNHLRISKDGIYIDDNFIKYDFVPNQIFNQNIWIGKGHNGLLNYNGKIYYFRFERKNSLYKHYLPCVRIYNLVDDNNELISENNIDYGFFESVNQEYYIADPTNIPAHTGDSLNEDYSNMLDINGNIISL